ncbi:polysaccharide deacetylase family protein [Flavobacterium phycosphaerae]|uniref:polysaccharide deacetylase family protein n=1 Tax=Flavobacterium phycosphaerae TaxID=2697515 RepID=UPI0013899773|nr:polysaccharide deacetylase family protein [Flavobacterium phycosphaerae]
MKIDSYHKILTYHDFENVSNFEKQLQIISRLPKVLVTTDDGDLSFYTNAFPLLVKYNIPAILFIIPSLIGTNQPFWWNEVYHYLGKAAGSEKIKELKSIPNQERVDYLNQLRNNAEKPLLKQQQLTVEQIHEMQNKGIVIANHSFTHPMFDQCTEAEIRSELQNTRAFFEENKLNGYSFFAYPNGSHNAVSEKVLKEEGIEYAFLFDHKISHGKRNPLRISRLSLNDYTPIWKFKLILSGWHSKLLPITKSIHQILKK